MTLLTSTLKLFSRVKPIHILILLACIWFYWFQWRPSQIRKQCDVARTETMKALIKDSTTFQGKIVTNSGIELGTPNDLYEIGESSYMKCMNSLGLK